MAPELERKLDCSELLETPNDGKRCELIRVDRGLKSQRYAELAALWLQFAFS